MQDESRNGEGNRPIIVKEALLAKGFLSVPNGLLRCERIPSNLKLLYLLILSYAGNGKAWPGEERLAREAGNVHESSIRRWLRQLREMGLVDWHRKGFGKQNEYEVLPFPDWLRECIYGPNANADHTGQNAQNVGCPPETVPNEMSDTEATERSPSGNVPENAGQNARKWDTTPGTTDGGTGSIAGILPGHSEQIARYGDGPGSESEETETGQPEAHPGKMPDSEPFERPFPGKMPDSGAPGRPPAALPENAGHNARGEGDTAPGKLRLHSEQNARYGVRGISSIPGKLHGMNVQNARNGSPGAPLSPPIPSKLHAHSVQNARLQAPEEKLARYSTDPDYRDNHQQQQVLHARRLRVETEGEGGESFAAGAAAGSGEMELLLDEAGVRGKLRQRVLAAAPSLEDARAAFLHALFRDDVRNPQGFASTILIRDEVNTLPRHVRKVSRLSAGEIAREEVWAGFVDDPEEFPWWLWFTTWEQVSPPVGEAEEGPQDEDETPLPPCRYGECERAWEVWDKVLRLLKLQMPRETFAMYLAKAHAQGMDENTLVVGVEDEYVRKYLEERLHRQVHRTLKSVAPGMEVRYEVPQDGEEVKR